MYTNYVSRPEARLTDQSKVLSIIQYAVNFVCRHLLSLYFLQRHLHHFCSFEDAVLPQLAVLDHHNHAVVRPEQDAVRRQPHSTGYVNLRMEINNCQHVPKCHDIDFSKGASAPGAIANAR